MKPTTRARTHQGYGQLIRLHLGPRLGHHQLGKLEPQVVQAFLNYKLSSGLSPRTVQFLRAILRRALGQALKWGLVTRNVATLVDPPRVIRPEFRCLSPEEAGQFLRAVRGDRLEALYATTLALGLRQGEVLGLRWADVDLDKRTLRVRTALQWLRGDAPKLVEPKTRQSRRTLPLPGMIIDHLRAHRVRQLEDRLKAGDQWVGADWDLVFCT